MITPKPDKTHAKLLGNLLAKAWPQMQEEYKKVVSNSAKVNIGSVKLLQTEKPHGRWEGNTRVIDFPRLQFLDDGKPVFEVRFCVAICTGKMSTKCWVRVGPPVYQPPIFPKVFISEIETVVAQYRSVTHDTSQWLFDTVEPIIRQHVKHFTQRGCLEVSSFGIRDHNLRRHFEQLSEADTNLADVLQNEDVYTKLSFYFNRICNPPCDLRSFITSEESKDTLLFTSPIAVRTLDHYIKLRQVLYLMRPLNGKAQVIGLAYDDSESGDISLKSATRVASILGWWI